MFLTMVVIRSPFLEYVGFVIQKTGQTFLCVLIEGIKASIGYCKTEQVKETAGVII